MFSLEIQHSTGQSCTMLSVWRPLLGVDEKTCMRALFKWCHGRVSGGLQIILPLKILLIKCIVVAICLILKDISEVLEVEEFSACGPACHALRGSFRAAAGSPVCNTLRSSIRNCGRFPSTPSMKCSEGPVSEAEDTAIFISRLKWKVSLFTTQLELVLEKPKVYSCLFWK